MDEEHVQLARPSRSAAGTRLLAAGAAYLGVIAVMFVLIALSPPPQGSIEEQLQQVAADPVRHSWSFVVSFFISPVLVTLMVLLAWFAPIARRPGAAEVVGTIFTGLYSLFVSIAYSSQFTILPRLLAAGDTSSARLWYFNNEGSVTWLMENLGYTFLGLGAVAIGFRLILERGPARWAGWAMWLMALTNFVSFVGYALMSPLAGVILLAAAGVSLPIGGVAVVWGARLRAAGARASLRYAGSPRPS